VPTEGAIDTSGLKVAPEAMKELFKIQPSEWQNGIQKKKKENTNKSSLRRDWSGREIYRALLY
jgi:hypothetical protein